MKVQEMENLSIAFKFMLEKEEIPLVNIGMKCAFIECNNVWCLCANAILQYSKQQCGQIFLLARLLNQLAKIKMQFS